MNETMAETRSVIVERELAYPQEKVWRALTQPHLMAEWLMANDFEPTVGNRFDFCADWGSVACEVLEIEPKTMLSYTWSAYGLESVVTWTLTSTAKGVHLRMEQTGFRPEHDQAYHGAKAGWPQFLGKLEDLLAGMD